MSPSPTQARSAGDAGGRKAVLFCPDCGHASPVDGDWNVRTAGDHRHTHCPECRCVVDDRRVTDEPAAPALEPAPAPVKWCVDTWSRYWSAWTTLLADPPNAVESDC
jgi:hypothetical protein